MKNKFSSGFEKINRSVVVFALIFAMLCPTAYAQSMYIAEDNFRNISSLAVSPAGSWDLDRSGGDVVYSATDGLILKDTSRAAPMVLSRDVNEYTGGIVTFEGVFHLVYKVEGFTFQIGDESENVAKIVTGPTDLRLYTGDEDDYISLCGYNAGVFPSGKFGVKLTFDVTAGTVSVWVDGTQYAAAVPIGSGKKLNRIIISTPKRY
ncbi:MAG: hypothetical protein IJ365_02620, partial [Clostridia bacterium]|nr:hypothetical protein [Clostridia bacterium]